MAHMLTYRKMYYLIDTCFLCLEQEKELKNIFTEDADGKIVQRLLKYLLPEYVILKTELPKHICYKCLDFLNQVYEFRQKCLANASILEEYVGILTVPYCKFAELAISLFDINLDYKNAIKIEKLINKAECIETHNKTKQIGFDNNIFENKLHETSDDFILNEQTKEELQITEELVINDVLPASENNLDNNGSNNPDSIENNEIEATPVPVREKNSSRKPLVENSTDKPKKRAYKKKKVSGKPKKYRIFKKYQCTICRRIIRHIANLSRHMQAHFRSFRFECEICCDKFASSSDLQKHEQLHNNPDSQNCPLCNKILKNKTSVKFHIRTAHKSYKCKFCPIQYKNEDDLKVHMKRHYKKKVKKPKKTRIVTEDRSFS